MSGRLANSLSYRLSVVAEVELVGVRAEADSVDLGLAFVVDVGFYQVFGEDSALGKEVVVFLQGVQGLLESSGHHVQLLRVEGVQVAFDRVAGGRVRLDAVQSRHQHRREREVRVA